MRTSLGQSLEIQLEFMMSPESFSNPKALYLESGRGVADHEWRLALLQTCL